MELSNDIVLRPRFTLNLPLPAPLLLSAFEAQHKINTSFVVSRIDDHVFIRIPKKKQHFWSPQLHLEIYQLEDQPTTLKGLFGPSPTVWTLFMFLHFAVILLFIAASVWLYTRSRLGESQLLPIVLMCAMVVLWMILYVSGRLGKRAGRQEMKSLQGFMYSVLNDTISSRK